MNIKRTLVLAAVFCSPGIANAIPMSWSYSGSGTCTFGCSGAVTVVGSLSGDSAFLGNAGELLGTGEVSGYSFTMSGGISEVYSGFLAGGSYAVDALGNITGGTMTFGDLFQLEFLGVGAGNFTFTDSHLAFSWSRGFYEVIDRSASGDGSYSNTSTVPEPGSLALLGSGLLALGLARRRRKGL